MCLQTPLHIEEAGGAVVEAALEGGRVVGGWGW